MGALSLTYLRRPSYTRIMTMLLNNKKRTQLYKTAFFFMRHIKIYTLALRQYPKNGRYGYTIEAYLIHRF